MFVHMLVLGLVLMAAGTALAQTAGRHGEQSRSRWSYWAIR